MIYTQLPPKKRGDTWLFSFTWESLGSPLNLESCTARMQVRLKSDPDVVSEADSITVVPETGTVNVRFNSTLTENLPIGVYLTDLQLTFPGGIVQSSDTFQLNVIPDQTLPL